jgi:hypothetical protein
MNDGLPEIFEQLRVPPAPAELRARVLGAVEQELKRKRRPRWERMFELASAACLLIGIGLTVWQWKADAAWRSRTFEPSVAKHFRDSDNEHSTELVRGPTGWLVYAQDLNFSDTTGARPRKRGT